MKNYLVIVLALNAVYLAQAQQDTFYLKNKFNENGTVITKDTTFMWAPLFYVNASNDQPISGVIVEKFRKDERITQSSNGFTLKQKSVLKKYTFYVFHDPKTQSFISIHYWNKKRMFKSYCINKDSLGVEFKKCKNEEVRKTVSKEEETVSIEFMIKFLVETLPQYKNDILEIFAEDIN